MTATTFKVVSATTLLLAIAVGGCAGADSGSSAGAGRIGQVSGEQALVAFKVPAFLDGKATHVQFRDIWQTEEYALFQGRGARSEILFTGATTTDTVVLEHRFRVDTALSSFNYNVGKVVDRGPVTRANVLGRTYWYATYTHAGAGLRCAGFWADWFSRSDDTKTRPSRLVLGYYCRPSDKPLEAAEVSRVLTRLTVGDVGNTFLTWQELEETAGAMQVARGIGAPEPQGMTRFPLKLAVFFTESRGDGRR